MPVRAREVGLFQVILVAAGDGGGVRWVPRRRLPEGSDGLRQPGGLSSPLSGTGRTAGEPEVSNFKGQEAQPNAPRDQTRLRGERRQRGEAGLVHGHHLATSKRRRSASACSTPSPSVSLRSIRAYPFKRVMDSYFSLSTSSTTSNQI